MRTGISAARAYGWTELTQHVASWMLDSYLSVEAFSGLQEQLNRFDIDDEVDAASDERDGVCFAWSMSPGRFRRTTRWRRSRWPRWTCSTTRTRSLGASVVKSWTR